MKKVDFYAMDAKDLNIIGQLLNDARTPLSKIAEQNGVSPAAIHQRIKKLEDAEVIQGSRIVVDERALGFKTTCFIGVFLERAGLNAGVADALHEIPEVLECYFTTGSYSLLTKIACRDNLHLMEVLSQKVQVIDGVARTETFIVLDTPFVRPLEVGQIRK